jgi:hypothetical protein
MPDDPSANTAVSVLTARAHRRRAIQKLRLAQRAHFHRAIASIHRPGLHRNGRANVMTRLDILQQVEQKIAVSRTIPQMMMRIDNRQLGFEDVLAMQGKPLWTNRQMRRRRCGDGHG